ENPDVATIAETGGAPHPSVRVVGVVAAVAELGIGGVDLQRVVGDGDHVGQGDGCVVGVHVPEEVDLPVGDASGRRSGVADGSHHFADGETEGSEHGRIAAGDDEVALTVV